MADEATAAAANVNIQISRKRKSSDFYNNFGVDDLECSPSNSPEPTANIIKCSVINETEIMQTSTDTIINKIEKEEISINIGVQPEKSDDLTCMDMEVENSPAVESTDDRKSQKPFISVIFNDNKFAIIFKSQIVNYIKNLVSFELIEECKEASDTIVNLWECPQQQQPQLQQQQQQKREHIEKESNDLFSVDTTPSKGRDCTQLPKYSTNSSSALEVFDPNKPNGDDNGGNNKASMLSCFNCDGNHAIRDCKQMKDYRRINMARNKYMAKAPSKSVRYHLDDEQKYKHLAPGKITEKLKKALNVRKHEVPSYIYRMRMFGYPPGWLEEAKVTNSSLELFDFQGCSVEESSTNNKKLIDANKIIEYPGFNVPLEKGDIDDYKYYRCPPYCEQFSKKTMLEYIESYTQSQNVVSTATTVTVSSTSKCESDSNSQESEPTNPSNKRSASPTLNDLELRKRQLLAELEDGCTSSPQSATIDTNDIIKEPENKNDEKPETEQKEEMEETVIVKETTDSLELLQTSIITTTQNDVTIESPSVVSSTFGTPILKTASPFSQLPDRDKWSKDISQVINFENLPNATGKYEQMTKVISKVRSIVKGCDENNKS